MKLSFYRCILAALCIALGFVAGIGESGVFAQSPTPTLDATTNLLDSYFQTYAPLLRYRFEERDGSAVLNSGTAESALDGTIVGTAIFNADSNITSAGKGITSDGTSTDVTFPSINETNGLIAFTILAVAKPNTAGESDQGILISKLNEFYLGMASSSRIIFNRAYTTTTATAITASNAVSLGNIYAFAARIDTDKVPHIFINGIEVDYGSQVTGVGEIVTTNLVNHVGGQNGVVTFDGDIYDLALVPFALTDEQIAAHYEAVFLGTDAETLSIGFTGTSITEAQPDGYRSLTQSYLRAKFADTRFTFPGIYWRRGKTWETLWQLEKDIIEQSPDVVINDLIGSNDTDQGRAEIEALIRRLRSELPNARIVLLVQPRFPKAGEPTNEIAALNDDIRSLATYYNCTVVDWTKEFYELLAAGTYTQSDLYNDVVNPTTIGHQKLANLLEELLSLNFIHGSDNWSGDLADYEPLFDDGRFENLSNYIAISGALGLRTGTWTTVAETQISSSAEGATLEFKGTFTTWGFHMGTYNMRVSIGIAIDDGVEDVISLTLNRPYILMGTDLSNKSHTIRIRVISGTFHLARFLAI